MLHIRKGDKVMVLSGEEKGKTGKVLQIFPAESKAIVEGVNIVAHHKKPRSAQEAGGIQKSEAPIHISKLQVICPETGVPTRVSFAIVDGEKVRISKKSGNPIDKPKDVKKAKKTTKKDKKDETVEAAGETEVKKTTKKAAAKAEKKEDSQA